MLNLVLQLKTLLEVRHRSEALIDPLEPEDLGLQGMACLLYTSPSPRDATLSRMPSSA